MKEKIVFAAKFIITVVLCTVCSKGVRVFGSIIGGEHGRPSFVTTEFTGFALFTTMLLVTAFVLLERHIPFKNRFIKGSVFIGLFWASSFFPQVVGMSGGESIFLSKDAMSFNTILLDSIGYVLSIFIIGGIMSTTTMCKKRYIANKTMVKASLASMTIFPCSLALVEFIVSLLYKPFLCTNAFGIYPADTISFYIIFYLFQAVSGLIFPIFFRFSEFNRDKFSFIRFGCILGGLLFAPIVLIVMFFGVDVFITIGWTVTMFAAILLDTYVFSKIIEKECKYE